ncbi:MAG: dienelactone hydrolase family protein [Actinomycetales bacterium]|nr:dienelactone hydrolase family protein [Actinomycetales bacterium]
MATILMFHHVQGLTPGMHAFADRLRTAGHEVHVPDLFDGRTFASIPEGFAYRKGVDVDALADAAAAALPTDLVYAGFSLGAMPAQRLAQTRAGARAALLFEACAPLGDDGFGPWPPDVPAQIHGMDADEFFVGDGDVVAAERIVQTVPGSELHLYPGDGHLFSDSSLPSYDPAATELLVERVLAFLESLDGDPR